MGRTRALQSLLIGAALASMGFTPHPGVATGEVDSFETCANAGYPVLQSYPRVCVTPDGRRFVANERVAKLSGIVGKVLIGPQCPVVSTQLEERCKDKPYRATIVVKTRDGLQVVTRFTSDRDGHFRIILPTGTYLLEPLRGGSPVPYGKQLKVTVLPGQFTDVTVQYDTGIR